MTYEFPFHDFETDATMKLIAKKDWPVLLRTGIDVRKGTAIAMIAEVFPPHPLDLVIHEPHKSELFCPPPAPHSVD